MNFFQRQWRKYNKPLKEDFVKLCINDTNVSRINDILLTYPDLVNAIDKV